MAKELPYFKFFCDEYLTGDITMENYEIQGIFINVCSQYWKQNCNTTLGKLKKRYRDVTEDQWNILINEGMIKVGKNEKVTINFLNEQWEILRGEHDNKVKAGKKSAEKRWGKNNRPITDPITEDNRPITDPITEDNNIDKDKDKEEDKDKKKKKEPEYLSFYRIEWEKSKDQPLGIKYQHIVKYLMNQDKNIIDEPGLHILKLKKQLSFDQYCKLHDYVSKRQASIKDMLDSWLNTPRYSKDRVSVYAVLHTWARKAPIQGTNFGESKTPIRQTKIGNHG